MKEGGGRWRRAIALLALGFAAGPQPTAFTLLSCNYGATPANAQADAAHEKCLKATDYKGCIESQGLSKKDEQLITGILWDSAVWKSDGIVKIKVNRMRGGGL